ncbi:hypothetical protein [Piscinibacter sp.]|uniref:hypothetical protein n=1 Tax=Piscinibacter sp. TaxID=1903157 RepID=UPI002D0017B1|nr:hypothetical protein [Albitalea sp.]HUG25315.1 hypothetical protein [Albitalea sp.]
MKITVTSRKPRNPLVAPAHFRRAGSHRNGGGSLRQQAGRSLQRELQQLPRPKYSP